MSINKLKRYPPPYYTSYITAGMWACVFDRELQHIKKNEFETIRKFIFLIYSCILYRILYTSLPTPQYILERVTVLAVADSCTAQAGRAAVPEWPGQRARARTYVGGSDN